MQKVTQFCRKAGLSVVGLCLVILICPISFGNAWKNSSYADTSMAYSYDSHYGSHDWIADAALSALLAHNGTQWNWLNSRKSIYLVGTEAPDNSDVSMTLDDTVVSGFADTTKHHVYFNTDGSIFEDDSAVRAKSCGDLANAAITEGKLDLGAFYLGAMTHYIADMSMHAHVAENNIAQNGMRDFDGYGTHEQHSKIEGYVNTRTNEVGDREEFFTIASGTVGSSKPYNATIDTAWETYKDPTPSIATTRDANWLHDNFFADWASTKAARSADTTTQQNYYSRVEECINFAILSIASAVNYVCGAEYQLASGTDIPSFDLFALAIFSALGVVAIVGKRYVSNRK